MGLTDYLSDAWDWTKDHKGTILGAGAGYALGGPLGAGIGGGIGYSLDSGGQRKEVLGDAAERSRRLAEENKRFQMEGIDKALARMGPARQAYNALYGDPSTWRL